jgi:coenzyme F420 hydrogenase subunit beta
MKPQLTDLKKYRNVCDVIVPNDLCSGCGVCAGVCPPKIKALKIDWNIYGELVPVELPGRCTKCGMCLSVCPSWNQDENETTLADHLFGYQNTIQRDPVVGLYIDLFAGYSKVNNHRIQGASGGLVTWLNEKVLTEGIVNRVCCVLPNSDPDNLFRFSIIESVQEIRKASRSVYYPVELSKVIYEILNDDGKYAITGLPCALKGLRLAMSHNVELRKRIIILIGLVCGQQKSKFFAEYLCALAGGQSFEIASASFRVKDLTRHHLDHRFEFTCGFGKNSKKGHVYQSEGMTWLWGHDCFKLNSCNFCDDITSEVADVAFGDAVNAPYNRGNEGTNFAIVRSGLMRDLLVNGASAGEIFFERVPLRAIVERQQGIILLKREDLQQRLYVAHNSNKGNALYIPSKRFPPRRRLSPFRNRDMEKRDQLRYVSRNTYSKYRYRPGVILHVERAIWSVLEASASMNWQVHLFYVVTRIIESFKNCIRGLYQKLYMVI